MHAKKHRAGTADSAHLPPSSLFLLHFIPSFFRRSSYLRTRRKPLPVIATIKRGPPRPIRRSMNRSQPRTRIQRRVAMNYVTDN